MTKAVGNFVDGRRREFEHTVTSEGGFISLFVNPVFLMEALCTFLKLCLHARSPEQKTDRSNINKETVINFYAVVFDSAPLLQLSGLLHEVLQFCFSFLLSACIFI